MISKLKEVLSSKLETLSSTTEKAKKWIDITLLVISLFLLLLWKVSSSEQITVIDKKSWETVQKTISTNLNSSNFITEDDIQEFNSTLSWTELEDTESITLTGDEKEIKEGNYDTLFLDKFKTYSKSLNETKITKIEKDMIYLENNYSFSLIPYSTKYNLNWIIEVGDSVSVEYLLINNNWYLKKLEFSLPSRVRKLVSQSKLTIFSEEFKIENNKIYNKSDNSEYKLKPLVGSWILNMTTNKEYNESILTYLSSSFPQNILSIKGYIDKETKKIYVEYIKVGDLEKIVDSEESKKYFDYKKETEEDLNNLDKLFSENKKNSILKIFKKYWIKYETSLSYSDNKRNLENHILNVSKTYYHELDRSL